MRATAVTLGPRHRGAAGAPTRRRLAPNSAAVKAGRSRRTAAAVANVDAGARASPRGAGRRLGLLGFVSAAPLLLASRGADAGLFGGGKEAADAKYTEFTTSIIEEVRTTLALPKDDDGKAAAVTKLRGDTNMWVATYRRNQDYSGRISYSNMYSALNAIAGHYNSFGTNYPIPKKRLDRIIQECEVAEKALAKGR